MPKDTMSKILYVAVFVLVVVGIIMLISNTDTTEPQNGEQTASFGEQVNYEITGIEPGAGVMSSTEDAMEQYGLSEAGWELKSSSAAAMLSALRDALSNEEPIIATVWQPHSSFALPEGELRKLEDPQNIYNSPKRTKAFLQENAPQWVDAEVSSDVLASVVYKGFQEDAPAAYEFLQDFQIPATTQSDWIFQLNVEEESKQDIASSYLENNQDKVESWMPSEDVELGKEKLNLGIPPWPGVTVKSEVAKQILEDIGYEVEVSEMDVGVVYTSLADEQVDINLAGWLPTTHQQYWGEHNDQLEIAGINVTKTWLGLAVPTYVDESIQSLNDLK